MKEIKSVVDAWFRDKLQDEVGRASAAAGEVVLEAVLALPERIAEADGSPAERDSAIDEWFVQSFHDSPVSYDTRLYNTLHAAKEELKVQLSADA